MWQELYRIIKQILTLKEQVEKNTNDIESLRLEVKELTSAIQDLTYTVQRNTDNESHEREKLFLRLENALMKLERRFLLGDKETD